jgi:hypothetical protein
MSMMPTPRLLLSLKQLSQNFSLCGKNLGDTH